MGPLPSDKYLSFFGVLKSAFEAQPDKKGELSKVGGAGGGVIYLKVCGVYKGICVRWSWSGWVSI